MPRKLRPFAPLLVLIALSVAIGIIEPTFFDPMNFRRIASAAAIPLVLALGVTFIIQLGSIDLSAEGVAAIAAVCFTLLVANNSNANDFGLVAIVVSLAVGAAAGLVSGFIHVKLKIPSFMATLGVAFIGTGVATSILGGEMVRVTDQNVRAIALTRLAGLPLSVWIALAAVAVAWFISRHTLLGRHALAIGGGEDLAKLNGVNVERVRIQLFTLAGVFSGLAAVLSVAQFGQGHALIAQGQLFAAITAVVVGGTSLAGGDGGPLNTLVGTLIVVVLNNGMVLMGVPPYVQQGVQGILIIVAVAVSIDRARAKVVK